MMFDRRTVLSALLALAAPSLSSRAWAQSYPSRPIKTILPFAPGGGGACCLGW